MPDLSVHEAAVLLPHLHKNEVRFVKVKYLLFAWASIKSRTLFAHSQVSLVQNR